MNMVDELKFFLCRTYVEDELEEWPLERMRRISDEQSTPFDVDEVCMNSEAGVCPVVRNN